MVNLKLGWRYTSIRPSKITAPSGLSLFTLSRKTRLKFSLSFASLDVPSAFEALSYAWGSGSLDCLIQCEGKVLPIISNCEAALYRLWWRWRPRVPWIDTICINQQSIIERNYQVEIMANINHSSQRTICWLGQGTVLFSCIQNHQACQPRMCSTISVVLCIHGLSPLSQNVLHIRTK